MDPTVLWHSAQGNRCRWPALGPSSRSFFPSSSWASSSRVILSPPLLARLHDFAHAPRWPNLENVAIRQSRMLADELYSMIHVPRLKDENAAELFFGFGIGAVGRCHLAVLPT